MNQKTRFRILFLLPALASILFGGVVSSLHAKAIEGVVNINTATVHELTLLPGVGKAKAEQIVQLRTAKPFASADDLKSLPGMSVKRLDALRPHIAVSGPTTAKKIAAPKPGAPETAPAAPVAPLS